MLLVIIFLLAALCALNWYLSRSLLYPPALFSGMWMALLSGVFIFRHFFYRISDGTLLFYFWGAAAFSIGGLAVSMVPLLTHSGTEPVEPVQPARHKTVRGIINSLLLFLIVGVPLYYRWVSELASESRFPDFWTAVRNVTIEFSEEEGVHTFSLLENMAPLAIIIALLSFYEEDGSRFARIRTWVATIVAIVFSVLSAGRAGSILLLIGLFAIQWMRTKTVNWKTLAAVAVLFLVVFSTIEVLLQKGDTRKDASVGENVTAIATDLAVYGLGAVVTFDRVHRDPHAIPAVWNINRVLLQAANKLGGNFDVPYLHAEYTPLAPYRDTNVYTMYFAYYPHYGLLGTTALLILLGAFATWAYYLAMRGSVEGVFLYALLFAGIVLSGYNEHFFMNANLIAKTMVVVWVLYRWPSVWERLRQRRPQLAGPVAQPGTPSP